MIAQPARLVFLVGLYCIDSRGMPIADHGPYDSAAGPLIIALLEFISFESRGVMPNADRCPHDRAAR